MSSRDEQQIGMRPWRDTVRDRSRGVPLATPPLLTIRALARIDSDDNDCDGGARTAAGGDDIDWTDIQGDDE